MTARVDRRAGAARASRTPVSDGAPAPLAPWAIALLGLWVLLLLAAPPLSPAFWAFNGFRSLAPAGRLLLVACAAGATVMVWRVRGWLPWAVAALVLALVLAIPLREGAHVLGDTDMRLHAILEFAGRTTQAPLAGWGARLHASPLDLWIDVVAPAALVRAGLAPEAAVAVIGWCLALLYLGALWRAAGAMSGQDDRVALAATLALSGTLEAFAGYAESAPLILATSAWWWSEIARPLDRGSRSLAASLAWLAVALAHRSGLVLLLPQLARLVVPWPGDRPRVRAALAALTVACAAAVIWVPALGWGTRQVGVDWGPLLHALTLLPALHPSDVVNGLVLVAPLVPAALLLLAGGRPAEAPGAAGPWRAALHPAVVLASLGALPLAGLAVVGWSAPNGLGALRDWDLPAAAGLLASFGAAAALAVTRRVRRAALVWVIPVLALQAGSWVAVNADPHGGLARATALAAEPRWLSADQRGTLVMLFAIRAMDRNDVRLAAKLQHQAFDLSPDVPRGTLAAEWLMMAGDRAGARAVLARIRTLGPPDSVAAPVLAGIDSILRAGPP